MARLIDQYGSKTRIIIEAHTYSYGKKSARLDRTNRMAEEILSMIKNRVSTSKNFKFTALGQGDYAPVKRNSRSSANERITFVFLNPQIR